MEHHLKVESTNWWPRVQEGLQSWPSPSTTGTQNHVWRPWREKWVVLEIIIQSCSKKERGKVSGVDNSVDKIVFVLFAFEKLRKKQM